MRILWKESQKMSEGNMLAYERAANTAVRALKAVFGTSTDVRPLAELQQHLSLPDEWTTARLVPRLLGNALHFRANYGRLLAVWCTVCAVRHPIGAFWVVLISVVSFHALLVRRGIVHITLPGCPSVTLMFPQLHLLLAVGSALAVLLIGRLSFVLYMAMPPMLLAAAHAIVRVPPSRAEIDCLAMKLSSELKAALRGEEADETDELETGAADQEPPERSDELAKRVEQIRAKYRPPSSAKYGRSTKAD
jgi:hypothetical protein